MTSHRDGTNSVHPATMTTIRHCSILNFGTTGACNQAVPPASPDLCAPLLNTRVQNHAHTSLFTCVLSKNLVSTHSFLGTLVLSESNSYHLINFLAERITQHVSPSFVD